MRDLADYGATPGFDDAENLASSKRSDPDKRALLLAGNRRGNFVALKQMDSNRTWKTRYVSTFSFRLFSAIQHPDPVLDSRSIVVPLFQTKNRFKANADPKDYSLWPHNRRKLIDDLWQLSLANLRTVRKYESIVNQKSELTGRNLEPWRPVLTIALWLSEAGATGLYDRMEQLAVGYQKDRRKFEPVNFQSLVFEGLLSFCAKNTKCARCSGHAELVDNKDHWLFSASELAEIVSNLAKSTGSNLDVDNQLTLRVGKALRRMQLQKPQRSGGKGTRLWLINIDELRHWTSETGVEFPEWLTPAQPDYLEEPGIPGVAGITGINDIDLLSGVI